MTSSYRPAKARINLGALRHNLHIAKVRAETGKVLAVIKADAYGHGMEVVATALQQDADEFGVASLDDVVRLRHAGIMKPIICLSGFYHLDEVITFIQHDAVAVIYDAAQLQSLRDYSLSPIANKTIKLWLKVDTGMGRLGFQPSEIETLATELTQLAGVELVGVLTHFSNSDEPLDNKNEQQFDAFTNLISQLKRSFPELQFSLSNSAAVLSRVDSTFDMIRPGIMLYGASPIIAQSAQDLDLRSVMTFESKLISIKEVKQGSTVGYGSTWQAPNDMRIGVVAVGYGDGYPRHAPTGTPVLVNGQRASLLGRVSMDLISIDLSEIAAKVGDIITLWGEGLPIEEIAESAGTISYELFCGVTDRVARVVEK